MQQSRVNRPLEVGRHHRTGTDEV